MDTFSQEDMLDPTTGILLTPSYHGKDCLGSGDHPDLECCCDECDYYLFCFPDWETFDPYSDTID